MSNKDKLRAYKASLRESENKETLDNIRNDMELYGSFHIDVFAERVCKIDDCSELRIAGLEYIQKINELRSSFEQIAREHDFNFLRR